VIGVGRRADLFLWDPYELSSSPVHDAISGLVYAAGPQNVRTVLVGGEVVIEDGRSTKVDERELGRELARVAAACAKRTGTTKFVTGRRFTPFTEYERWTA
jgi:5-methylthioadenosine/S-adenosylhomocysteine deaminase